MELIPLEPAARENLVNLAKAFCNATGKPLSFPGRWAHSDPTFFSDLIARHDKWVKAGKPIRPDDDRRGSVTLRVYDRCLQWFQSNWPDGTEFPQLNYLHPEQRIQNGPPEKESRRTEETSQAARPEQAKAAAIGGSDSIDSTSAALRKLRGSAEKAIR